MAAAQDSGHDIQLVQPGLNSSSDDASFTLTTISWQTNDISFYHEAAGYTCLCFGIGICATLIFFAFLWHHIYLEILGLLGCLFVVMLCFLYYAKHCFGLCWKCENRIVFNQNTKHVDIYRNGVFIDQIPFRQFTGVSYNHYYVYLNRRDADALALNVYRSDPSNAREFVLTVTEIWPLIQKSHRKGQFVPIQLT